MAQLTTDIIKQLLVNKIPVGTTGPRGAPGIQGYQGAAGSEGAAGPQGYQGAAGSEGAAGPQGYQGVAGPQGYQGPAGSEGAAGPQGYQGAAGPQGYQGPAGSEGAAGPQGYQGAAGPQGYQGATGLQGVTGSSFSGGTFSNDVNFSGSFSLGGVLTPTVITSNTDNYEPTGGLSNCNVLRISSNVSAGVNLTGLKAPNPVIHQVLYLLNVGTKSITLKTNSTSSILENRFLLGTDKNIQPDGGIILIYDIESSGWRSPGQQL